MAECILDTNIFVRFLIKDIPSQFEKAQKVFEKIEKGKIKGLVSILVMDELIWILENYYEIKKEIYIPRILTLLALKNLRIMETKKELVIKILKIMEKQKIDFTDVYLSQIASSRKIISFDKGLAKLIQAGSVKITPRMFCP